MQAVALMLERHGQEHILAQEDGKEHGVQVVTKLAGAFALCASSDEATKVRDDVSYSEPLQAALNKRTGSGSSGRSPEQTTPPSASW
jgi:hypothetical protein